MRPLSPYNIKQYVNFRHFNGHQLLQREMGNQSPRHFHGYENAGSRRHNRNGPLQFVHKVHRIIQNPNGRYFA